MSTKKKSLLGGSKSKKASVAKSEVGTKGAKIKSMRIGHSKRSVHAKSSTNHFKLASNHNQNLI